MMHLEIERQGKETIDKESRKMKRQRIVSYLASLLMLGVSNQVIGNNGNPVGTPQGAFTVSPTGSACYTMSIDLPSVNTTLVPTIGIVYNSQSGNGVVGWGCNISGISVITRGTKDYFHDGVIKGISHTPSDAYYLDGKRLILESGMDGCAGAVYRIEGDPVSSVTINSGTHGIWFAVHTADGLDYEYGKTYNSKQTYVPLPIVQLRTNAWYVDRISNSINDYITYTYNHDETTLYVTSICYGNTYLSSSANIDFEYETRDDVQEYWIETVKGRVGKRLRSISSNIGSQCFRTYHLSYDITSDQSGTRFSRLTSVTESNGQNESLNPVSLTWDYLPDHSQTVSVPDIALPESNSVYEIKDRRFIAGDINKDGLTDIVQVSNARFYYSSLRSSWSELTLAYVFLARKGNGSISYDSYVYTFDPQCYLDDNWYFVNNASALIDLTGDGYNDLVIPQTVIVENIGNTFELDYVLGRAIENTSNNNVNRISINLYNTNRPPLYVTADFNQDGKCDVFTLERDGLNNNYQYFYLNDILGLDGTDGSLYLPSEPSGLFTGDFNGNGLQDILVVYSGGYKIFWNVGGSLSDNLFPNSQTTSGTNLTKADHIYQGDFNGDGLPDFLLNNENDNNYYFALGSGNGNFIRTLACQLDIMDQSTSKDDNRFSFLVYDLNHDGKSDAVFIKSSYEHHGFPSFKNVYKNTDVRWLLSTGNELQTVRQLTYTGGEDDAFGYNLLLGDFTGKGEVELLNIGKDIYTGGTVPAGSRDAMPSDNTVAEDDDNDTLSSSDAAALMASNRRTLSSDNIHLYRNADANISNGKVEMIVDGMGNSVSISYEALTNEYVYTRSTSATYPVFDLNAPLHVVSSVTTSNGASGSQTENYHYSGLKYHALGRGLLGFSSTSVENTTTGYVNSMQTIMDSLFYVPKSIISRTTVGNMSSYKSCQYALQDRQNGRNYFQYPLMTTESDWYGNQSVTSYIYDTAHCYLLSENVAWDGGSMYKQTQYRNHVYAGGRYQPTEIIVTQQHADDPSAFATKTSISYNAMGLQTAVTDFCDTDKSLTKNFAYDNTGHLLSEYNSGEGLSQLITYYQYNANKQLVHKYTSPSSYSLFYSYDQWGNMLAETDSTNAEHPLITTNVYDGWGNLSTSTSPTGQTTTITRGWGTTSSRKYFIRENKSDSPQLTIWYDAKGVKTREETIGECGVAISTNYQYNNKGQLYQKCFTKGNLSITDSYTYDNLGRVISESSTTGASATYNYGNRILTTAKASREYVSTFDAWGNVLTSTDPVSSITYTYYSNGKPHSVTSSDGSTVTMTYDAVGNQVSLIDPDAGQNSYEYDAAGRVISQTNARGMTTVNTYDALGRITTKTVNGETTSYTYGSSGNSVMSLLSMQNAEASISYTYDQYRRVVQETRSLTGEADITFHYNYNDKNQIQSIQHPNSVFGIYSYDSNGFNRIYLINGTTLWKANSETGLLTTSKLLSDNLDLTEQRDYRGYLMGKRLKKGTDYVQNMSFNYNGSTGNLHSRSGMIAQTEDFIYDDADRLLATSAGGTEIQSVTYADNGNIIRKTGLGQYYYDSHRPHAVTGIDNTDGLVPSCPQAITYTSFGKIQHISDGEYELDIVYGPDQQRWKSVLKRNGVVVRKILYADNYEQVTSGDTVRHFYYGEYGTLCVKEGNSSNTYYYICTDNQGSITKIVDSNGIGVFEATYDAWGRQTVTRNDIGFHRGYTGHEMMPEFGLINMNGRVYDPLLGRFLSPDNFVQQPDNSQNFNRYSYCLNNPLKYTDPKGNSFTLISSIVIGAMMNWYCNGGEVNWKGLSQIVIGGAVGASSYYGGQLLSSKLYAIGIFAGSTTGALSGAIVGGTNEFLMNGINNLIYGRNFSSNWWSSTSKGFISGAITGAIAGGIEGYNNAKDIDANIWTGDKTIEVTTYSVPEKTGVLLQQDPSKHCYAYAGNYMVTGHNEVDISVDDFINAANNTDGADFGKTARNLQLSTQSLKNPKADGYQQLSHSFTLGKKEIVLAIGNSVNEGHAVNLISYDIITKQNILGGGFHKIVKNIKVWDPIVGKVVDLSMPILQMNITTFKSAIFVP